MCALAVSCYLYIMSFSQNIGLRGLLVISFFITIACGGDHQRDSNAPSASVMVKKDTTLFGVAPFEFPYLSSEAQEVIADWPVFKDFRRISLNLQKVTIEDLKFRSKNLLTQTDSLAASLPKVLDTPILSARLLVVQTRLNLLHMETKKGTPQVDALERHLTDLRLSIAEFVLHINEKLEKDALDRNRKTN